MAEAVDELLVKLGLQADRQSFDNGISMFNQLRGAAVGLSAALGVGVGGATLTTGFANARQELGNFAQQMGVSAQSVRGLEFAFEQVGGEAGEARSAIEGMVRFRDALMRGDAGAFNAMSMLGLDPRAVTEAQDAQQAIERVMQSMQGMSEQQRRIILQDMGINSPAAFRLFGQGAEQLGAYMEQAALLAPVTERQIELANDFNQSIGELSQAFQGLADIVSEDLIKSLLPIIEWANETFDAQDTAELLRKGPFMYWLDKGIEAINGGEGAGSTTIRRGQGRGDTTLGEALGDTQGPPSAGGVTLRRGQSVMQDAEFRAKVAQAEREIGAPPGLLWAQIGQESSYNPYAVSSAGARGLAQIMPTTERSLERRFGEELDPFDPDDALRMQKELMRENYQMSGNWDEALRMYHGGWDRDAWGEINRQYAPSIRSRMQSDGNPQASINQSVTIQVDGAGDPRMVAMEVERVIRQQSERAANDFRSSIV